MEETGHENISVSDKGQQIFSNEITPEWSKRLASQDLVARYGNRVDPITLRVARNRSENSHFLDWIKSHPRIGGLATAATIALYLYSGGSIPFMQNHTEAPTLSPAASITEVNQIPQEELKTQIISENVGASLSDRSSLMQETEKYQPQTFEEKLLGVSSLEEKAAVERLIQEQVDHYTKNDGKELDISNRIADTLRWQDLVDEVVEDLQLEDPMVKKVLLPLIFVESEGNPTKKSDVAAGLGQMQVSTAMDMVNMMKQYPKYQKALEKFKFKIVEMKIPTPAPTIKAAENSKKEEVPDLFDPRTNITLSLLYLDKLHKYYPNFPPDWTYHLGEGNAINVIKDYVHNSLGVSMDDINKELGRTDKPGTASLIEKYDLSFIKLVNSTYVQGKLKSGEFGDDTQYYVPRIAGATRILKEAVR